MSQWQQKAPCDEIIAHMQNVQKIQKMSMLLRFSCMTWKNAQKKSRMIDTLTKKDKNNNKISSQKVRNIKRAFEIFGSIMNHSHESDGIWNFQVKLV